MARSTVPAIVSTRASITTALSSMYGNALGTNGHNSISYLDREALTYNGNQYAVIVDPTGHIIMAKRAFPSGAWTTADTGNTTNYTDSHNDAVIGIDTRGYIHLTWNMHASPLNYQKSVNPEDISAFAPAAMTGQQESGVSYPRFFNNGSKLFFAYRSGDSYSADQELNVYDATAGTWSVVRHPLISGNGASGYFSTYCDNFVVDNAGNIHVSFMWRTQNTTPIQLSNYSYAWSPDNGTTWKRADGTTYTLPITYANADIFDPGYVPGLINQQQIDVDGNGHPHIGYWKLGTNGHANYHHAWHNGTAWSISQITSYTDTPTAIVTFVEQGMARANIKINRSTNRVYVFGRPHLNDYLYVHSADAPYTTWTTKDIGLLPGGMMEFGGIDTPYWHANHTLMLAYTPQYNKNPGVMSMLTADPEVSSFPTTYRLPASNRLPVMNFPASLKISTSAYVDLGIKTYLDGTPFTFYGWTRGTASGSVSALVSYGYKYSTNKGYNPYTSMTGWLCEAGSSFPSVVATVPQPNVWCHQAWVYNGVDTLSVYLNGIFVSSIAMTPRTADATVHTFIGHGDKNANCFYARVGIHAVDLTPAEIAAVMSGVQVSRGSVGYYALDEGTGTIATDSSGNGNHGTISGGVWSASIVPSKTRAAAATRGAVV